MTSSSIKDHAAVVNLLEDRKNDLETFSTYAPSHRFIEAVVSATALSFAVKDEDGSIFAMALGRDPVILKCDRLATSRGVIVDGKDFEHRADWDFYSINTAAFTTLDSADTGSDSDEIAAFLNAHAPDSSVWPDDPEILFWGQKRISGELVALGALVQWRTGQVMFASIGTHFHHRNKGLAQQLVREMLARVAKLGVAHVGLGVFAENVSAKRAYENVGFNLVNEFTSYRLLGS
ncbi:NAT_SF domain containing protein [Candidatus Nanopelagicaceae bacterium]